MHASVMEFVGQFAPEVEGDVLELGSRNVNGTVRELFTRARSYIGIDMVLGPCVDVAALARALPFPDKSFDCVVSTEMLEHDLKFWESLSEALRVLRPNGFLILTCRGLGFPFHEWPSDYYRFTPEAIADLLFELGYSWRAVGPDPQFPGVFALAGRPEE